MVPNKLRANPGAAAVLSALLLLSACGGGGGAGSPPLIDPAPQPQPAPDPAPAPQPVPEEVTLASTYTDVASGVQNGQDTWADNAGTGAAIAGVECIGSNVSHNHTMLSIYRDGVRLAVPASIGLKGCTYELHTHDRSGMVHIEPNVDRALTLGQFFAVWGQPLSRSAVAGITGPVRFYLIDNETLTRFEGDPSAITFGRHKEIVIITGTVPIVVPKYRWPATL